MFVGIGDLARKMAHYRRPGSCLPSRNTSIRHGAIINLRCVRGYVQSIVPNEPDRRTHKDLAPVRFRSSAKPGLVEEPVGGVSIPNCYLSLVTVPWTYHIASSIDRRIAKVGVT